ncbi:hypothetical protein MAR_009347 [Mya arenaria]|uniref:Uncharacterized protein n=1 Tax=Mya arenaria TaxID=6604 RepID=A0ABY7E0S3_MYAAR|nr:hypothetical protein MAR_009347 [Mya arenaria]
MFSNSSFVCVCSLTVHICYLSNDSYLIVLLYLGLRKYFQRGLESNRDQPRQREKRQLGFKPSIKITSVRRHIEESTLVDVDFYAIYGGDVVTAADAVAVFSKVSVTEAGDYITYPVISPVRALLQTTTTTPAGSGGVTPPLSRPMTLLLVTLPTAVAVAAVLAVLVLYCQVRKLGDMSATSYWRRFTTLAARRPTLDDVDMMVDVEKGEIVSRGNTKKAEFSLQGLQTSVCPVYTDQEEADVSGIEDIQDTKLAIMDTESSFLDCNTVERREKLKGLGFRVKETEVSSDKLLKNIPELVADAEEKSRLSGHGENVDLELVDERSSEVSDLCSGFDAYSTAETSSVTSFSKSTDARKKTGFRITSIDRLTNSSISSDADVSNRAVSGSNVTVKGVVPQDLSGCKDCLGDGNLKDSHKSKFKENIYIKTCLVDVTRKPRVSFSSECGGNRSGGCQLSDKSSKASRQDGSLFAGDEFSAVNFSKEETYREQLSFIHGTDHPGTNMAEAGDFEFITKMAQCEIEDPPPKPRFKPIPELKTPRLPTPPPPPPPPIPDPHPKEMDDS